MLFFRADGTYASPNGLLKPIAQVWCFGTSYMYGTGGTVPTATGLCGLIARDTPGPAVKNYGAAGSIAATSVTNILSLYAPASTLPGTYPSIVHIDGGENDSASENTTYIKNSVMFEDAWVTIPQSYRVMGSAATQTSGTWAAGTAVASGGSGITARATSGAQLTFSVPSANAGTTVGLNYIVNATATGSFGVTIDGTAMNDPCSGTTTWGTGPCGGNVNSATTAPQRVEFTGLATGAHTVVLTTKDTTATLNAVAVDWLPPAYSNGNLAVANQGFVFHNTVLTSFAGATAFNPVIKAVVAQLAGEGLPDFLVDLNAGFGSARAMNVTTDLSTTATTACPASTTGGHPNDCGYQVWENIELAVAQNAGYQFAQLGAGGKTTQQTGKLDTGLSAVGAPVHSMGSSIGTLVCTYSSSACLTSLQDVAAGASGGNFSVGLVPNGPFIWAGVTNAAGTQLMWGSDRSGNTKQLGYGSMLYWGAMTGTALASAATVAPTAGVTHVTGTVAITTITPPTGCTTSGRGCTLTFIPDAAFTTATGGNIALGSTAVVNRALILTYDPATALWYPNY